MSGPISVLLADDHSLVRDMLSAALAAEGFDVEAASTADEALAIGREREPDVAVMDIDMPGMSSFEVARRWRADGRAIRVVFLSAFVRDSYVGEALAVEAAGYLTKDEPPGEVVAAIREVAAGEVRFSRAVLDRIALDTSGPRVVSGDTARVEGLTARELEVVRLIARGHHQKQVATDLEISIKTVQHHLTAAMDKLGIHDRVELARFAIREGLVEP